MPTSKPCLSFTANKLTPCNTWASRLLTNKRMKIKTLCDIYELATSPAIPNEKALNMALLSALRTGDLTDALFLEYLSITQVDVTEALHDSVGECAE